MDFQQRLNVTCAPLFRRELKVVTPAHISGAASLEYLLVLLFQKLLN
jgi:hypothetical protein